MSTERVGSGEEVVCGAIYDRASGDNRGRGHCTTAKHNRQHNAAAQLGGDKTNISSQRMQAAPLQHGTHYECVL